MNGSMAAPGLFENNTFQYYSFGIDVQAYYAPSQHVFRRTSSSILLGVSHSRHLRLRDLNPLAA